MAIISIAKTLMNDTPILSGSMTILFSLMQNTLNKNLRQNY